MKKCWFLLWWLHTDAMRIWWRNKPESTYLRKLFYCTYMKWCCMTYVILGYLYMDKYDSVTRLYINVKNARLTIRISVYSVWVRATFSASKWVKRKLSTEGCKLSLYVYIFFIIYVYGYVYITKYVRTWIR